MPINSLDDLHVLFDGIPLEKMNTSMTINATAMWLLSLYIGLARERGIDEKLLTGTTQNDIVKEYLARGTYIFPPDASFRLISEMYEFCLDRVPEWNASNVCSYHLQEAGATPVEELSFALSTAIGVLDSVRARGHVPAAEFGRLVGRISFFVNSGIRFVEEICKMRAFTELWDELCRDRYGVTDPKQRRFRYGVQVNSLGLTETQPENNAWRILLETLGVTLSRNARCRALQLPAWNEALSLPRPWDQQWSLRLQQVLAYETDLLEYGDLFDGSPVMKSKVDSLKREASAEIERILQMGGVKAAIESGYLKTRLVHSMSERMRRINTGEQIVVGQNKFKEGLESPLVAGADGGIFRVDDTAAKEALAALAATRKKRDTARAQAALARLKAAAQSGENMMEASIECALARVTTGEWGGALREVFGEYRPHTGVDGQKLALENDRVDALRQAHRRAHREARAPAAPARRQARPRRSLQRRRGHRGLGAARGPGRRVLGHPPHRGRDRAVRRGRGRRRDRRLHPVRLARRARRADHERARAGRRQGPHPPRDGRHHPAGRLRRAESPRRAAHLHARGLRAHRDHGGDRAAHRGARLSMQALIERALAFHTLSVSDLVAIFEDARPAAAAQRREAIEILTRHPRRRHGLIVGVTGTPGSGKSSLLGRLALAISDARKLAIAILAVDPSSPISGGALLGDRVRVRLPVDRPELYFRSQASESELGGLGPDTFQVCRLLHHLFDLVFVETVGIGQSELDVRWLADRLYLVMQPLGGDEVQMLKAGILEVPDAIVVNKCDEQQAARKLVAALRSSLPLSRPFGEGPPAVLCTSALSGEGIEALCADVLARVGGPRVALTDKEVHFFRRWVRSEWGRVGERLLDGRLGGASAFLTAAGGFDEAQARFADQMK